MKKTLNEYLKKLKPGEKGILCSALSGVFPDKYQGMHHGLLPFVPIEEAAKAVHFMAFVNGTGAGVHEHQRVFVRLLSKLESYENFKWHHAAALVRALNDVKVHKRFGHNLDKGSFIPLKLPKHVKRERKMFEKKIDAFDCVKVACQFKRLDKNLWQVTCAEEYRHHVDLWLRDNVILDSQFTKLKKPASPDKGKQYKHRHWAK